MTIKLPKRPVFLTPSYKLDCSLTEQQHEVLENAACHSRSGIYLSQKVKERMIEKEYCFH